MKGQIKLSSLERMNKEFRQLYFFSMHLRQHLEAAGTPHPSTAPPALGAVPRNPLPLLGVPSAVGISTLAWRPLANSPVVRAWRKVCKEWCQRSHLMKSLSFLKLRGTPFPFYPFKSRVFSVLCTPFFLWGMQAVLLPHGGGLKSGRSPLQINCLSSLLIERKGFFLVERIWGFGKGFRVLEQKCKK